MKEHTFTVGRITFNTQLVLLIIVTTIVPMLDVYKRHILDVNAYNRFIFYFVIPIAIILLVFRESPREFGLRLGNWKEGLLWTIAVCILIGAFLYGFARTDAMQSYYAARAADTAGAIIFRNMVELFAWEFVWRGFLLFGLARHVGIGPAIWLQAVPFAYMHLGKPELETLSTIFGGAGFGFVAWRTQSFLYGWLIHWFMAAFTVLIAAGFL